MTAFGTVDELLDFAMRKEEEAAAFYTRLAEQMDRPWMKEAFLEFAAEERGHRAKLEGIKSGKRLLPDAKRILDLGIAEQLVDPDPAGEMDYAAALVVAMKEEKAAFKMYSDLARATDDPEMKATLLSLAQEEAKHKLRFEVEYDNYVLAQN